MSDHVEGSIVRIRLRNFLTYSHSEFYPGPNMNMVIGPNGTGKSTVVCAIALGLGGKPDVLGRAKDLTDFIKHGESKARIEIELKSPNGNAIIRRTFSSDSRVSQWQIDGRKSSESKVKELVDGFNIQVDNLCQFLPQDKVAGFAKMDPIKLLQETERAAGGDLLEDHETLERLNKEFKVLERKTDHAKEELDILKEKNTRLERDVQRYNDRELIMTNIKKTEIKIVMKEKQELVEKYTNQKREVDGLKRSVETSSQNLDPLKTQLAAAKLELEELQIKEKKYKGEFRRYLEELKVQTNTIQDKGDACDRKKLEIKSLKKKEAERTKRLAALQRDLDLLSERVETKRNGLIDKNYLDDSGNQMNPIPKIAELDGQIEELNSKSPEYITKIEKITAKKGHLQRELGQLTHGITQRNAELRELDNVKAQRLHSLKERDNMVYKGVLFLRENRGKFKGRIFEPVVLELGVTMKNYADIIEGSIPYRTLTTFLCEEEEDYYEFRKLATQQEKLRLNIATTNGTPTARYMESMDKELLEKLRFEKFAIETVEGPDLVLNYLCQEANLHRLPISSKTLTPEEIQVAERNVNRFVAGRDSYSVKRAYGSTSLRCDTLRKVDINRKNRLESEIEDLERKKVQLIADVKDLDEEDTRLREEFANTKQKAKELHNEKTAIKTLLHDYEKMVSNLDQNKRTLQQEKQIVSNVDSIRQREEDLVNNQRVRVKDCAKMMKALKKGCELNSKRTIAVLQSITHEVKIKELSQEIAAATEENSSSERLLNLAKERLKKLKDAVKKKADLLTKVEEKYAAVPELMAVFNSEFEETLDELETQLAELNAQYSIINDIDPQIMVEYNNRLKEIAKLEEIAENQDQVKANFKEKMQKVHDKWKGALDSIVEIIRESFSASFEAIGCVGDVRIKEEPEDYSKWGIEILVKFRAVDSLQPLTATRQSGGEKSVSTMLYLIALQKLSKSPFRVVDEINQGMDPRNERLVHKLIVNAACEGTRSQYFLITPKLLPDLDYHQNMTVLCIFNGVWQPEKWDLKQIDKENAQDQPTERQTKRIKSE